MLTVSVSPPQWTTGEVDNDDDYDDYDDYDDDDTDDDDQDMEAAEEDPP